MNIIEPTHSLTSLPTNPLTPRTPSPQDFSWPRLPGCLLVYERKARVLVSSHVITTHVKATPSQSDQPSPLINSQEPT